MKKCPFCAEEIQEEAVKCRFCGEFLKKRKKWVTCLIGCLGAFLALTVGSALLVYLAAAFFKFVMCSFFFGSPGNQPSGPAFGGPGVADALGALGRLFADLWDQLRNYSFPGGQRIL